jgi:hypothetical protein
MADRSPENHAASQENTVESNNAELATSAEHEGPTSEVAQNAVRNLGDLNEPDPQNDGEEEESKIQTC